MESESTVQSGDIYSSVALTCGVITMYVGCIAVLGWALGWQSLISIRPDYLPIAPNTAFSFTLLGGALLVHVRSYRKSHRLYSRLSVLAAFFVLMISALSLARSLTGVDSGIDSLLLHASGRLGEIPVGYMSPVTAVTFAAAALAILMFFFNSGKKDLKGTAAALAACVAFSGLVTLLGYLYGTPFFYGGGIIPVAFATAFAFAVLGIGMIAAAGPWFWPLRPLVGPSIHARMMRAFLPLTIAIFFVEDWLNIVVFSQAHSNPALIGMMITLLFIVVVSAIVSEISQFISSKIEHSEAERRKMQDLIEKAKNEWEETFDIINDAITIHDRDFNIIRANKAATELLGVSFSMILSKKCFVSYHGTDCPPSGCPSCKTLQSGINTVSEIFEPHLKKFIEIKALARFDKDNNIVGVVHVMKDITARRRSEIKLEESQERLTAVLDSLDAAVYAADMETYEVLYANKYLRDMFGNVEGKICWQVFRRSLGGPCKLCANDKLLDAGGTPSGIHSREFLHASSGRWYSISDRAIRWVDGRTVRLEIAIDITEHKRTEATLLATLKNVEEEKAKSEAILAAIGDGISIQDTDFRVLYQNRIHKNFVGDHAGEFCYIAYEKRDKVCEGCPVELSFRDGEIHKAERWLPLEKGKSYYEITTSPLRNGDGKIIAGIEIVRDITGHKTTNERLQREKDNAQSYLDIAGVMIVVINADQKISLINRKGCEMLGYGEREIIGENWFDTFVPEAVREESRDRFSRLVSKEIELFEDHQNLVLTKGGVERTIAWHNTVLRDEEGNITGTLSSGEDITEGMRLENQLRHAQKMEAVGQLAGGIAHDFNNILTAIMGYVYMLQIRMDKNNPLMAYVEEILDSAAGAANLTRSLLAFSRKQLINPKTVNINEIIKRAGKLLKNLIGEDIDLKIMPACYDLPVVADSLQIEQVLMNLVTNAKDAMPAGGEVYITTELVHLDTEFVKTHGYGRAGEYALVSVSDSGTGMDERTKEKIFEPFFTTKETGKGTGLGLSIVFGIVKQHNGYINVYSEQVKGTTFRIYLPLIRMKVLESSMTDTSLPPGGSEVVLVAEDEAAVRRSMKNMLEGFGYTVIEATDGKDAIEKFMNSRDTIRLVILDVVMPRKNGKEAYEELKKVSPDVKVLFTSGYTADIIHKKGVLDESMNFISKPVMPNELLRKVREVLDT